MERSTWVWCRVGGEARGAYATGLLSVLLPELGDQVSMVVGTSAGALSSVYLVAKLASFYCGVDRGRAPLLARTLGKLVDFDRAQPERREQRVALRVVTNPAHGNRSAVFHQGGIPRHHDDTLRMARVRRDSRAGLSTPWPRARSRRCSGRSSRRRGWAPREKVREHKHADRYQGRLLLLN